MYIYYYYGTEVAIFNISKLLDIFNLVRMDYYHFYQEKKNEYLEKQIFSLFSYLKIQSLFSLEMCISKSKVGDRSRQPEGSLFKSYYTEV